MEWGKEGDRRVKKVSGKDVYRRRRYGGKRCWDRSV